jgi:hypothetical protein
VGDPAGRGTGTMRGWAVLVPWRLNVSSRRENVHHSRFTSGGGLRCHRLRSAPPAFEYVARLVYAHSSRVAAAAGNRVFRHRARREPQGSQSILPCDPCGSLRAPRLKVHLPPALTIRMGNGRWEALGPNPTDRYGSGALARLAGAALRRTPTRIQVSKSRCLCMVPVPRLARSPTPSPEDPKF